MFVVREKSFLWAIEAHELDLSRLRQNQLAIRGPIPPPDRQARPQLYNRQFVRIAGGGNSEVKAEAALDRNQRLSILRDGFLARIVLVRGLVAGTPPQENYQNPGGLPH